MARKGVIEIVSVASHGIRLLQEENNDDVLPLIGRVVAGEPLLTQEHIESYYRIDATIFRPIADFLLRVNGMYMKNIGIMDGDLLAVHKTQQVHNSKLLLHVLMMK